MKPSSLLLALCLAAGVCAKPPSTDLPAWIKEAGARPGPIPHAAFHVSEFGATGNGTTPDTAAIQKAIDACAQAGGGTVDFKPGKYLTGALFVKSHVHLKVAAGVTLLGSNDEALYPDLPTRVAGIEMAWPAALSP